MSLIEKKTYHHTKIERIKNILTRYAESGTPKFFEIIVDGIKVIPKTDKVEEFDAHQNFIDGDTKSIEIKIHYGTSNNNDQYIYLLEEEKEQEKQPQTLAGMSAEELQSKIKESIDVEKEKWRQQQIEQEYGNLKTAHQQLQQEHEALKKKLTETENGNHLKFGQIASVALEEVARRNTKIIKQLPGGETLAGFIEKDNKEQEAKSLETVPETEASFTRKEATAKEITEEEQQLFLFSKQLVERFKEQLPNVIHIINLLADAPVLITTVEELLKENQQQIKNKTKK